LSQKTKRTKQKERKKQMRRTALYARVSTRRQEKEATIESQVAQLEAYLGQNEYEVAAEHRYIDQAQSGKYLARPGLDRLRDAALSGAFEVLVCSHPDRLARQLGVQQVVLNELRQAGVEVIFLSQPDLADDPQGQLLLNIQGAFAEYERVVISDRMRRGRLYRLRQGQTVPHQAPYGYRFEAAQAEQASRWLGVPAEMTIVKQMFECYTQKQIGLGQLAQQLNQQGTPSPQGKRWTSTTIHRMLRQPAYKGTAYYNRHQTDYSGLGQPRRQGQGRLRFPRYNLRPVEDWIAFAVPPVIDETTWQAAQERLEMNTRFAPRNSRRTYLLRGLLVCDTCHYTLQGRTQKGTVYYTCTHGASQRPAEIEPHTCSLRADRVEPLVWQALQDLLRDPSHILTAWQTLQAEHMASPSDQHLWRQRQTILQKQRQRLLDAYQAEALSLTELIHRQNPLEIELRHLEKSLAQASPSSPVELSLSAFTQRIELALSTSDIQTKQEVLRLLIERIVVSDEALTVEHIIPTVNISRLHPTCCET
jgi:site-specific DNA recombinase